MVIRRIGQIVLGILLAALLLWSAGALYYAPLLPEAWRAPAAVTFVLLAVLAFVFLPRRGRTAMVAAVAFVLLVGLFFRIPASNDRDFLHPILADIPNPEVPGQ